MDDLSSNKLQRQPLHQQVNQSLSRRILDGEFPVNSFLPNEYELSRAYNVSIGTIRRAVEQLVACQLVDRMQGRGTIVTAHCWADLVRRCNRYQMKDQPISFGWLFSEIAFETCAPPHEVAQALKLAPGELAHFEKRTRGSESGLRIYEEIWFPQKRFPDLSSSERRDVISLARFYGVMVGKITEATTAVLSTEEIARHLEIDPGEALLRTARITHDREGTPVEYRIACTFLNGGHLATIV